MAVQRVQIVDLEPSTQDRQIFYVVQIRGVDSEGNPGAWSKEFIFQSSQQLPPGVDDIIDETEFAVVPNDILVYEPDGWSASPILFDGTVVFSDGSFPFTSTVSGLDPVEPEHLSTKKYVDDQIGTVDDLTPSSGTVTIDFSESVSNYLNHTLTGSVSYLTTNIKPGRTVNVRIVNDSGSSQNFTFPAAWSFNGSAPASIADGKVGLLTLRAFGITDNTCTATYQVN